MPKVNNNTGNNTGNNTDTEAVKTALSSANNFEIITALHRYFDPHNSTKASLQGPGRYNSSGVAVKGQKVPVGQARPGDPGRKSYVGLRFEGSSEEGFGVDLHGAKIVINAPKATKAQVVAAGLTYLNKNEYGPKGCTATSTSPGGVAAALRLLYSSKGVAAPAAPTEPAKAKEPTVAC